MYNGEILYCQWWDIQCFSNGTCEKIAQKENCYQSKSIRKYLIVKKQKVWDSLELTEEEAIKKEDQVLEIFCIMGVSSTRNHRKWSSSTS